MTDTARQRATRIVDEVRERLRELAEIIRDIPGGKRLAPVPVRANE